MPILSPQNIYFCENGQRDIRLDSPYESDSLLIYLNGKLSVIDEDYVETDTQTITFLYNLSSSDVVITQRKSAFNLNISVINDSSKASLYKKYGAEDTLIANQKYTFSLKHGNQEFSTTFFTRLSPYYSTVTLIRTDLGDVISYIPDDRIMLLIHNNSINAEQIASEDNLELLETEEKTPYVFKQYVRYRTELDLMMAVYLAVSGQQGSVNKILGELEIKRDTTLGSLDLKTMLDDLKKKLKEWETLLRGTTNTLAASAVRAGKESYPLYNPRRTFASPPGAATSEG